MSNTVLYENEHYTVQLIPNALSENGQAETQGYGIFNKTTGVMEATGLVLPECQWRADQFSGMTLELAKRKEVEPTDALTELAEGADEDVTLN